jgi:acyl carrier protein
MSPDALRKAVLDALLEIAPEADPASIAPSVSLRDQLDIDSFDFLNFMVQLSKTLHVDVPESDYPKLGTLENCLSYLAPRVAP